MNYFRLKFGSAAADQARTLQTIKQNGGDGIQNSDGLCLKTPLDREALCRLLSGEGLPAGVVPVDPRTPDLSADEKNFLT